LVAVLTVGNVQIGHSVVAISTLFNDQPCRCEDVLERRRLPLRLRQPRPELPDVRMRVIRSPGSPFGPRLISITMLILISCLSRG